jgi:hypothetical protein
MRLIAVLLALFLAVPATARLLGPGAPANTLLEQLAPLLEAESIDVAHNLNAAGIKTKRKLRRPRLGMLVDVTVGEQVSSAELEHWEASYRQQLLLAIVAIAAVESEPEPEPESREAQFLESWFASPAEDRIFITLAAADRDSAAVIAAQLQALDYDIRLFSEAPLDSAFTQAGRFYATAGQRLVLDSPSARQLESRALEVALLGRVVRRKTDSVFPPQGKGSRYYASGEPERFRKVDLGDEIIAAVIPEIIVSGGIALGETATFEKPARSLIFNPDHSFELVLIDGERWLFPERNPLLLKTCFDFALRSSQIASDAIIDIDEHGKIKISSTFRNTDIGYQLIRIDQQPFEYVRSLNVIKSVIIDTAVRISAPQSTPVFNTEYEIRFINPDRRKLAETRAALVYDYDSSTDVASYRESWGPRAFRIRSRDQAGLGEQTRKAAEIAGWVALFRAVVKGEIEFSRGRYEFLKIDKAGRPTPRRSPLS